MRLTSNVANPRVGWYCHDVLCSSRTRRVTVEREDIGAIRNSLSLRQEAEARVRHCKVPARALIMMFGCIVKSQLREIVSLCTRCDGEIPVFSLRFNIRVWTEILLRPNNLVQIDRKLILSCGVAVQAWIIESEVKYS